MPMYLVVIGWLYVALLMAVAEASHPAGSVLGAVFTFLLYGVGPAALVTYLLATPMRRRARRAAEQRAGLAAPAAPLNAGGDTGEPPAGAPSSVAQPDERGHAPGDAIAPVREKS